jgi:3-dehydroquinate synthase
MADPREKDKRRILNFGHTFGHAFERIYGFNHGEAVSLGMAVALKISAARGLLSEKDKNRILSLLEQMDLPINFPLRSPTLFEAIRKDKKRQESHVHFVLISKIGTPHVEKLSYSKLEEYFDDLCESEGNRS